MSISINRRKSVSGYRRRSTIITIDEEQAENENFTEEEIMENYRQILSTIKTQTWPMYRKIKVSVERERRFQNGSNVEMNRILR